MSHRTRQYPFLAARWSLAGHGDDDFGRYPGTWSGTELYATFLKGGQCADFNQASHIDCGDEIVGNGAVTVCVWIYLDDFGENGLGRICDNGNFDFYVNDTNDTLDFSSNGGGTVLQTANNSIVTGAWQFVAASRDDDGAARLHILNTGDVIASGASGAPAAGTGNFTIGDDTADANAFDGRIRDVRIYSVALTRDEINDVMHFPRAIF